MPLPEIKTPIVARAKKPRPRRRSVLMGYDLAISDSMGSYIRKTRERFVEDVLAICFDEAALKASSQTSWP
jgi:hypothetical protein